MSHSQYRYIVKAQRGYDCLHIYCKHIKGAISLLKYMQTNGYKAVIIDKGL